MKIAKIIAAATMLASCGAYAASATKTFVTQVRSAKSAAAENAWNCDLDKAKAYAVKNKMPLVVVWSNGDACSHCVAWEKNASTTAFKNYVKESGIVWVFGYPGDKHHGARNTGKIYKFAYKNQNQFPLIRIYWPAGKVDKTTTGDTTSGGLTTASAVKKQINYFKSALKKYKYSPLKFTIDSEGTLTKVEFPANRPQTDLAIPSTVKKIAADALKDNAGVLAMTLPESVTEIEDGALSGLSSLKRVTFLGAKPQTGATSLTGAAEGCTIFANPSGEGWDGTEDLNGIPVKTKATVTFSANGGEIWNDAELAEDREISIGSTIGELPAAVRAAYALNGWYTAASGGAKVASTTVVKNDLDLFAQWAKAWTITLNPNGGVLYSTNKVTVAKSKAVGTLASPAPTKEGYNFAGWYTKKSGGAKITTKTKATKSTTYYAHWTAKKYKIVLKKEGSGTVSGAGTKSYKSKFTIKSKAASSYVFQGWYTTNEVPVLVSRKTSYTTTVPLNGATYVAKFVTKAADKEAIGLDVNGAKIGNWGEEAETVDALPALTNTQGIVIADVPVASQALTATSVTASGLPAGISYNATKKAFTGTPTKDGEFTVKVTVKASGGSKTYSFKWTVVEDELIDDGVFYGWTYNDGKARKVTITVAESGKLTATVGSLNFTRTGWTIGEDGQYKAKFRTLRTVGSGKKAVKYTDVLSISLDPEALWTEDQISGFVGTIKGNLAIDDALEVLEDQSTTLDHTLSARRNPFDDDNKDADAWAAELAALGTLKHTDANGIVWNLTVNNKGVAKIARTYKKNGKKVTVTASAIVVVKAVEPEEEGGETEYAATATFLAEGKVIEVDFSAYLPEEEKEEEPT